jgi:hypothetical protein
MNINNITEKSKAPQSGAAAVEFALIAIIFFTLLLGIIEFGRFLYVRNTIQEVTRAAAREAVVSLFTAGQIVNIQKAAVFHSGASGNPALPGGNEITSSKINIHYMSSPTTEIPSGAMPSSPEDNIAACLDATRTDSCIRFVLAEVCARNELPCTHPVLYRPMIGLFSFLNIAIPASSVIMPAESMGYSQ